MKDERDKTMRSEYDFSEGIRGRHSKAYRAGHTVEITKQDGPFETHRFTEEDGSVLLDPDVKQHFPDSESVNKALRSLIAESRSPNHRFPVETSCRRSRSHAHCRSHPAPSGSSALLRGQFMVVAGSPSSWSDRKNNDPLLIIRL